MTRLTEALTRARLGAGHGEPGDRARAEERRRGLANVVLRHRGRSTRAATPRDGGIGHDRELPLSDDVMDKIVLGDQADAGLVEQCRRVAAVLHHAQTQRGVRSVMVGSAVAAEGKTLTATNIALTLSHSFDRRVLLIDADLRRSSVHEMFGLPNEHGLVDTLLFPSGGRLPVHAVSRNLWVLTAGRPTPDPMSALVSDMMKQLLVDAMAQFDWVIIDTPPVALMPDANLLAGMIDGALLVVSACTTPYPLVRRAALAIGAERILGVVLNRADRGALAHEYGYHYDDYDRAPRQTAAPRKRFGLLCAMTDGT